MEAGDYWLLVQGTNSGVNRRTGINVIVTP